jgi:hypothetical protein
MVLKDAELKSAIVDELHRHTVMTLALAAATGPHAVSLMYACNELDIHWLSDPKTRHSTILASNPRAAITVAAQSADFQNIRGLQIEGNAQRLVTAEEESAAFDLLLARYSFLKKFGIGKLARHLHVAAVYRFRPTRMTLIDNQRRFGFKQTLQLPDHIGHSNRSAAQTNKFISNKEISNESYQYSF